MSIPHSAEAEQALLGALLLDNSALPRVAALLDDADFYRPEHRLVFGAIRGLVNEGKSADVIAVFERLESQGQADAAPLPMLHALTEAVSGAEAVEDHARIVANKALQRQVLDQLDTAANLVRSGADAGPVLKAAAERAASLRGGGKPRPEPLRALDIHALAAREFRPREPLLSPWLCSQDLAMVFAPRGVGKTHFCIAAAYAIATGGTFANWTAPKPRRVLYLDGELPGAVMQKRMLMHCPDREPEPGFLRVFTPDLMPDGKALPDVATLAGQEAIEAMIEPGTEVVFLDNLSAWARTGRENEAESWLPIADWILGLRRRGIAVVIVHHGGKNGQQRGTSKREDLLDVVIGLSRPQDYNATQGATFVAEFTKARNLTGADGQSIELTLDGDEDRAVWRCRTVEASTYERVVKLAKEDGLSPGEIAAELAVNKSTVSRHLRAAREAGVLPADSTARRAA